MSDYPRGRDTSGALTEVRTVLSRAETALDRFERGWYGCGLGEDPDREEMRRALDQVVSLLDRWRRTGRPLKRT